ncbi:MAG: hypothetical protein Q4D98_00215 [Planctomycetia bacterium]|nr:hypothetical protein [Planctomycetia bacterium]
MTYLVLYLVFSLAGYVVLLEWKPEPIFMGGAASHPLPICENLAIIRG